MRKQWSLMKELFSGWTVFAHLIFYYLTNGALLYVLTKDLKLSGIVAIPAAFLFLHSFSFIQKRIARRRLIIQEINKYATSLTFYLNSGHNVPNALKNTLPLIDPILQKDIQQTLDILSEEARLDTTHFQKYNLSSLDLFHQTLLIKYEKGGNAKEMFMKPFKGIQFEISEIDDLIRKKALTAQQIYVMQLFSVGIAGGLAFLPGDIYKNFLTLSFSIYIVLGFYVCLLFNIYRLQEDRADMALRL
ncbi:hypothetical protein [Peribacillus asahii]|uniref:hypothetical protein n=1 Tax=Peribacillus asahii TaxID=228899 RepID=UPI00207AFA18|nr:hypothetical protein [Peribacillus asahii]USK62338.1 hypothetical protein LIT37_22835 [Peribacillus asahii]